MLLPYRRLPSLTTDDEHPQPLRENILECLLDWLAAGITPQRSTLLLQSAVQEHAELSLPLGMLVTVPRLERNPTDKGATTGSGRTGFAGTAGLSRASGGGHPHLPGRYRAGGRGPVALLELARELARRFNLLYGDFSRNPNRF